VIKICLPEVYGQGMTPIEMENRLVLLQLFYAATFYDKDFW